MGLRVYSACTYGNYNSMSIVMMLCMIMLIVYLNYSSTLRSKFITVGLIFGCIAIEVVNTSRGCLIAMLLAAIPLYKSLKGQRNLKYFSLFLVIALGVALWSQYSEWIEFLVDRKLSHREADVTNDPRFELILGGLRIAADWLFVGSGPGSQIHEYHSIHAVVDYAHNLWIQCLVEYGLVITVILTYAIVKLIKKTYKSKDRLTHLIGLLLLMAWPMLTVVDEAYLKSFHWVFFASILSIYHSRLRQQTKVQNNIALR